VTDIPTMPTAVNRFLDQSATLSTEDWTAVYWRFVHDPSILRAVRAFQNVATQAWLDHRGAMSEDAKAAESKSVVESNARISAIAARLPEDELDADRGGHLRQRCEWIMTSTRMALENVELLSGTPKTRKAVKRFLTVFADLIDFPEYP
jgi:hypothetical protein